MNNIEPEDMPVCPYCDNAMLDWDELLIFEAHGCSALAHKSCLNDESSTDEPRLAEVPGLYALATQP